MIRFRSTLFFVLFILSFFCGSMISAEYRDIPSYSEFKDAVEYVTEEGYFEGYMDGRFFRPNAHLNRAEFVKILVSIFYEEEEIQDCIQEYYNKGYSYVFFPDISTSEWYAPYVCVAQEHGIVTGYPDGNFYPERVIPFVEGAKMIANQFEITETYMTEPWYESYVLALDERSAIPETVEMLNSSITRAEMAEMLYRLLEKIDDKNARTYADLLEAERRSQPAYNRLVISKINKEVPLVTNVGGSQFVQEDWRKLDQELMYALRDGVVLYPGAAAPGRSGNVFIVGHSSFYANDPGKYKTVFADLANLEIGDTYTIYYEHDRYVYKIFNDRIIDPTDISVLEQPLDREISTLMTCWPIGTNKNRRVFVAERIE